MSLILATPSKTLNHIISIDPNLDHQNPSLSEFWSQAKVQVKVQKWGMSSICTWTLGQQCSHHNFGPWWMLCYCGYMLVVIVCMAGDKCVYGIHFNLCGLWKPSDILIYTAGNFGGNYSVYIKLVGACAKYGTNITITKYWWRFKLGCLTVWDHQMYIHNI